MTLITFANVVVRYVFASEWFAPVTQALDLPTNMLWALEATVFLFAWMVLLGASYCVKINAHLGVDVLVKAVGPGLARVFTGIAILCCIAFAVLLLIGSWNYWAPFANLPPVPNLYSTYIAEPLGLPVVENQWRDQAWYEVNDVPMGDWLRFLEPMMNEGERYTYIPKFIPYAILPLGMALLVFRFVQAGLRILRGDQSMLIASHEAEDDIDAAAARAAGEGDTPPTGGAR
jgi:C4-dicarboxylate transporter DctQ subunit